MARGVVLGGSCGIGAAVTERLVRAGDDVVVMSRGTSTAEAVGHVIQVDVRSHTSVSAAFTAASAARALDYVINCVGIGFYAPIGQDHADTWNDILATNVTGLLNVLSVIDAQCPDLAQLLHVSSMAAHRPSRTPGNTCYAASKTAANSIIAQYRQGLRDTGRQTRVCVVSPGVVGQTGFSAGYYSRHPGPHGQTHLDVGAGLRTQDIADLIVQVLHLPSHIEIIDLLVNLLGQP
jgi:NADP-dependent 3-hydroxy acid dehydrogenase YdfG